jgi:hypothetical protein
VRSGFRKKPRFFSESNIKVHVHRIGTLYCRYYVPQHTSVLTGQLYFNKVMETFSVHRFHQADRMGRETFVKLRSLLKIMD